MNPFWEIKILLTETNASVIRMVEKTLEASTVFYYLRRIENIHDLNFELKYNKPDLIISGIEMNGFDAIQVLDMVNFYTRGIPILVLISETNKATDTKLVNHGAYDIIYNTDLKRLPKEVAFISERKLRQVVS